MGVPRFFRWISERYPKCNSVITDLTLMPVFDNLYLDMNGIIHQCSHPDDNAPSPSERDMLLSIFAYIDRIVKQIVRPQKVLYIAVDGVAPRAKLNQQRSRRFAAAKEASSSGGGEEDVDGFDRNCITPGTSFMARIGDKLRGFIRWKIGQDPAWSHLKVVYSGANVKQPRLLDDVELDDNFSHRYQARVSIRSCNTYVRIARRCVLRRIVKKREGHVDGVGNKNNNAGIQHPPH